MCTRRYLLLNITVSLRGDKRHYEVYLVTDVIRISNLEARDE